MSRGVWQRSRRVATWGLVVALASVSSVVCVAGATGQMAEQHECCASMGHDCGSMAHQQACCVIDAPNFVASFSTTGTVLPAPTLAVANPSRVATTIAPLDPWASLDSAALKPSSTPTYLLVSVFRI